MGVMSRATAAAIGMLLVLVLPPRAARGADRPLTLDDAIRMALVRNETLLIERESVAAARFQ